MEITIRLVLVAMVGLITASIAVFLATGQVDGFTGFLDSQSTTAKCELLQNKGKVDSDRWQELDCEEVLGSDYNTDTDRTVSNCDQYDSRQACSVASNCQWTGSTCT